MFTYTFENDKKTSLYMQLYSCIKADILSGKLARGEKLPSKRAAAKHLGVSVITIENAYAALQSEGYIYSLPKKGFYVNEISKLYHPAGTQQVRREPAFPEKTTYRYDFSSNGILADNFPFSVWAHLMRKTFHHDKEELIAPSPSGGISILQEALCTHLKQFRGMDTQAYQIIIGAGTEYLYSLLIQLLGGKACYALQNPGYPKIAKIYESVGVKSVFVPEDENGMSITHLYNSCADVAHISPSHSFPSGKVMSISRRHELLNWANEADNRYIIEDDYDCEFRLSGKPLPALQSLDKNGKVIYVNTFTKSLSPTVRISYMVLPKSLTETFYRRLGFYACTVSNFEQYTLAGFIREGYFEKHINRMRNYYKKIRNLLLLEIKKSPLAHMSEVAEEKAGLHFLLKLKTDIPDALLKQKAADAGIHISFLSEYYHESTAKVPAHIIVMNYSALKKETIPAAVQALEQILQES